MYHKKCFIGVEKNLYNINVYWHYYGLFSTPLNGWLCIYLPKRLFIITIISVNKRFGKLMHDQGIFQSPQTQQPCRIIKTNYNHHRHSGRLESRIPQTVNSGLNWCKSNCMTLNPSKSKAMLATTSTNSRPPHITSPIEVVDSWKFLFPLISSHPFCSSIVMLLGMLKKGQKESLERL